MHEFTYAFLVGIAPDSGAYPENSEKGRTLTGTNTMRCNPKKTIAAHAPSCRIRYGKRVW